MYTLGIEEARETRGQIVTIHWIMEKARECQENTYFCFTDCAKAFDCVDHNKLWKILKEMRVPDHLTCLLRNLFVAEEAAVRTGHGTTDWFIIGKGIHKSVYCHLAYLTSMQIMSCKMVDWMNQAEIKTAGRNINNLRYADDIFLL